MSKGRIWGLLQDSTVSSFPSEANTLNRAVVLNPVRKTDQPRTLSGVRSTKHHRLLVNKRVIDMQPRSVLEIAGNCHAQGTV
jgi:hypothetical protein